MPLPIKLIDMTKVHLADGKAFVIDSEEATVNGRLVKRLSIPHFEPGSSYKTGELVVAMKNTTDHAISPDIKIAVYNRYGMVLGNFLVHWVLDTVAAGTTHSDNAMGTMDRLSSILGHSSLPLPKDVDEPAYVVVIE